jgi:FkbM family methyltransferase
MNESRVIERAYHISKLTLLEVFPLYPFLHGREQLNIVEVGANIGLWCEAFHNVFGHRIASYRAFEPMPANVERLRQRCVDLDISVDVTPSCIGDSVGEVTIHYDREVTTLASVVVSHMRVRNLTIDNENQMRVPQTTLDQLITGPVDLVKIDTEGYEWNVLQGADKSFDHLDNIYFEFGPHQGHLAQTFRQFFEFFVDRGYRLYRQTVGRNYFGLNEIRQYTPALEDVSSMWMILASRNGPAPTYRGPRVVGQLN